jgi:hypothetical protein
MQYETQKIVSITENLVMQAGISDYRSNDSFVNNQFNVSA